MARQKIADIDTQLRQWRETVGAVKTAARCPLFSDPVYLEKGGRTWTRRYMRPNSGGKESFMSLGQATQTFAEVETRAKALKALLVQGIDPGKEKLRIKLARAEAEVEAERLRADARKRLVTVEQAAEQFIATHEAGWSNANHRAQWKATLKTYVFPIIGDVPLIDVTNDHVLDVITPIWHTIPETAGRVRGRLEQILDFGRVRGWRDGPNPAAWGGNLKFVLPARAKIRPVVNHPALPWQEIPDFMALLRVRNGVGVTAITFAILTAARSGEVRGCRWSEIDFASKVWSVPGPRMKTRQEHRVPLSAPAIELLESVHGLRQSAAEDAVVFPGGRFNVPMSDMALTAVLKRMGRRDITQHGFRSTFRDWAGETGQPHDIAETALAHTRGKTHGAYQRGDLLQRRRDLMDKWAAYCFPHDRLTAATDSAIDL